MAFSGVGGRSFCCTLGTLSLLPATRQKSGIGLQLLLMLILYCNVL